MPHKSYVIFNITTQLLSQCNLPHWIFLSSDKEFRMHYHSQVLINRIQSDSDPSSSKPVRSTSTSFPLWRAYSNSAKWQKTYWSGIWIEYARWDLIFSTVPFTSIVPTSSKRRIQMSRVQNVPEEIVHSQYVKNGNDYHLLRIQEYKYIKCSTYTSQKNAVKSTRVYAKKTEHP